MISYQKASSKDDLQGILDLQKINLKQNLDINTQVSQGFVTVNHSFEELKKLNDNQAHIIGKAANKVIAYTLSMSELDAETIPVLRPMFEIFNNLIYKEKSISEYKYLVVGQACVAEEFRGQGVLDACYEKYRETYKKKFDFAITEIAVENLRSRRAHTRIGFQEIHEFTDVNGINWVVVLWDWREGMIFKV